MCDGNWWYIGSGVCTPCLTVIAVASIKQAAGVGTKLSSTAVVGFARPHLS